MKWREDTTGNKEQRKSKTGLQRGAFGQSTTIQQDLKVVPKHLRTAETCNRCGVKGKNIPFTPVTKNVGVPATKKGKLASTYVKFNEGSNKYVPKN
jgi:hypothetical protein